MPALQPFRPLVAGEPVAVVAPAADAPLATGVEVLARRGHPAVAPRATRNGRGWSVAEDRALAADINDHLRAGRVGALFCARGGYGAARVLPFVDAPAWQRAALPLVGMSDITALHLWLQRWVGIQSLYGPVVSVGLARGLEAEDEAALWGLLAGEVPEYPAAEVLRDGQGRGPLTGGCLTLLCHSLGSEWEVETAGRVLFIEEVNERPYAVDRCLTHLRQAGKLAGLAGLLVGTWWNCGDGPDDAERIRHSLLEATAEEDYPILTGIPCGHGPRQMSLPLGASCEIDGASYRFVI
jgi:muramoyltetrapeptide carboxypeptidase